MLVPFGKALISADFLRAGACAAVFLAASCSAPGLQQSMQQREPVATNPPQAGTRTQSNGTQRKPVEINPPEAGARTKSSGAQSEQVSDTALPPNNLAGAYLVRPEANSCFWEENSENKAILTLCGVSIVAEPQKDPKKKTSEGQLHLEAGDAGQDPVLPLGAKGKLAGLLVNAKDAAEAIDRAQEFLNPSFVVLNTDSEAIESKNRRYFKYKTGKFIIYGRMDHPEKTFTPKSIAFGLEFRKVSPSIFGSLPLSLEPGALHDALIGRLLTEAGLQFLDPSAPASKPAPGSRARMPEVLSTTSLTSADLEAILRTGSEAIDELFKSP